MEAGHAPDSRRRSGKRHDGRQRRVVSTLERLPAETARSELKTPAIFIVGQVCALPGNSTGRRRDAGGARVIVTGRKKASALSERLGAAGCGGRGDPAIETVAIADNARLWMLSNVYAVMTGSYSQPSRRGYFFGGFRESKSISAGFSVLNRGLRPATEKELHAHGLLETACRR
jgi:uroporphyrinogen III methyltransferase/synthase